MAQVLWIAANELPLVDDLIPFLMARSGQALDEFCRWVVPCRKDDDHWIASMIEFLPMSPLTHDELLERFRHAEDPEVEARRQGLLEALLEGSPRKKQQLIQEGRLTEARNALRRVLTRRQLALSEEDGARIDACTDLAILERWHDRAVTAASVAEALA